MQVSVGGHVIVSFDVYKKSRDPNLRERYKTLAIYFIDHKPIAIWDGKLGRTRISSDWSHWCRWPEEFKEWLSDDPWDLVDLSDYLGDL